MSGLPESSSGYYEMKVFSGYYETKVFSGYCETKSFHFYYAYGCQVYTNQNILLLYEAKIFPHSTIPTNILEALFKEFYIKIEELSTRYIV